MYMYRFAQKDLLHWFESPHRKPLILRGARQVGKSTLVRNFCHDHQLTLLELNLEKTPLKSLIKDGYSPDETIQEIEFLSKQQLTHDRKKSILFLDEIQEQPKAINLLRYFYEDKKELAVIAAGSLLEVALKQNKIE